MLSKKKRVTKDLFQQIMTDGNVVYGSFFVFKYIKQEKSQYAFTISKKITKTAVKRNAFRRKGYNILRFIDIQNGAGVFLYKKEGIYASVDDLKKDIIFILKKAKIL